MGFGSTAKTLQKVADMAEDVYKRLNELREQVRETQETVGETRDRVDDLESEVVEQRAIVEAIAREHDLDLESIKAEAHIDEAEDDGEATADGDAGTSTPADASPD